MGKGAGVIAYTEYGDMLIVYENVEYWSFPKGHRIQNKKTGYKEPWIKTAEREFRQETCYPYHLELDEEKRMRIADRVFFLYKMSQEEMGLVHPDNDEVLQLFWLNVNGIEEFKKNNRVNATIEDFNVENFIKKAGPFRKKLNPYAAEFVPGGLLGKRERKRSVKKPRKVKKSKVRKSKKRSIKRNSKVRKSK